VKLPDRVTLILSKCSKHSANAAAAAKVVLLHSHATALASAFVLFFALRIITLTYPLFCAFIIDYFGEIYIFKLGTLALKNPSSSARFELANLEYSGKHHNHSTAENDSF
jgi:hypothetical protein